MDEALIRRARILRNADPEVLRHHPNVLIGPIPAIVDLLNERRETTGVNYVTIPHELIEDFAPIVAQLSRR